MSRLHELRPDQVRDGDGVVDRRTVPAVRLVVIPREVDVQVGDEAADAPGRAQALLDVAAQERLMRDVEADHRHVEAAREHRGCRLRIAPDVELGRRREVPLRDRAAHEDDPRDAVRSVRREVARDVRQRAGRDEHDGRARLGDGRGHERRPRHPRSERRTTPAGRARRGRSRRGRALRRRARARAGDPRPRRPARRCARRARGRAWCSPSSSRASGFRTSS